MEGKKIISIIMSITVIGLLIAFIGPTAIDGLSTMIDDAENFEETTISDYENTDITLYYNKSTGASNNNNTFNFTDLQFNGTEVNSTIVFEMGTSDYHANLTIDSDIRNSEVNTGDYGYNETSDSYIGDINYIQYNYSVDSTKDLGDGVYELHMDHANMTVSTTHTYSSSTTDLMGLLPIMVIVAILVILIAIVMKVMI